MNATIRNVINATIEVADAEGLIHHVNLQRCETAMPVPRQTQQRHDKVLDERLYKHTQVKTQDKRYG